MAAGSEPAELENLISALIEGENFGLNCGVLADIEDKILHAVIKTTEFPPLSVAVATAKQPALTRAYTPEVHAECAKVFASGFEKATLENAGHSLARVDGMSSMRAAYYVLGAVVRDVARQHEDVPGWVVNTVYINALNMTSMAWTGVGGWRH